jgi:hypothetical protein
MFACFACHADNPDPSRRLGSLQVDLRLAGVRHFCFVVHVFVPCMFCVTRVVLVNCSLCARVVEISLDSFVLEYDAFHTRPQSDSITEVAAMAAIETAQSLQAAHAGCLRSAYAHIIEHGSQTGVLPSSWGQPGKDGFASQRRVRSYH